MNTWLVILPLAIPFGFAAVGMGLLRYDRVQRWFGMAGAIGQLVAGVVLLIAVERDGIHVLQMANWDAPFGISLVADRLSAVLLAMGGVVGVAGMWYAAMTVSSNRTRRGYFPLANVLLLGVASSFLSGDIFNLYVSFEVMLIASFVLLALGGARPQIEGAMKYVTLNLFGSIMLLAAAGLLYSMTGTLNMADLSVRLHEVDSPELLSAVSVLLLAAFGLKAAVFPLFAWLPASYHTPPGDVTTFFSGLLTKVGVYAIIRTVTLIIPEEHGISGDLILLFAGMTMVVGVLGAIAQSDFRRLLAFHSVSQVGYMLMGIGIGTALGLAGSILFITHHMVTKSALFHVAAIIERREGTGWLYSIGGLMRSQPLLAVVFGFAALSLAGIPPFAGFVAKLTLVRAGLDANSIVIVVVALAVSVLTLLSMTKIWLAAFWEPRPESAPEREPISLNRAVLMPVGILVVAALAIGIGAGPYLDLMLRTAEEVLDSEQYITAVLEARP